MCVTVATKPDSHLEAHLRAVSHELWAPDASDKDAPASSNPSGRGSFGFPVPDPCNSKSYDAASLRMVGQGPFAIGLLVVAQHEGIKRVDDYLSF